VARTGDDRSESGRGVLSALFGWTINDQPMGPGESYTMLEMRGRPVRRPTRFARRRSRAARAALEQLRTVKSADEAATKAQSLGATCWRRRST